MSSISLKQTHQGSPLFPQAMKDYIGNMITKIGKCLLFSEGKIIGYYSLLLGENNECELNNLCVSPVYRHRKIGEQLLNHCFTFAKSLDISKIRIGIVEENTQLRKWYEAHGFIHVKTEKYDFFPFTCGYMEQNIQQNTK